MYFIRFSLNDINDGCKIREQFLSHSFNLIYSTFEKSFNTLSEAKQYFYKFLFVVGTSSESCFEIVEATQKDQDTYLKGIIDLKDKYEEYLRSFNANV